MTVLDPSVDAGLVCVSLPCEIKKDNGWLHTGDGHNDSIGYGMGTLIMTIPADEYDELLGLFQL
jgi:hypothetical protein